MYIIKWHKAWNAKRKRNIFFFLPFFLKTVNIFVLFKKFFMKVKMRRKWNVELYTFGVLFFFFSFFKSPENRKWDNPVLAANNITVLEITLTCYSGSHTLTRNYQGWWAMAPSTHMNPVSKISCWCICSSHSWVEGNFFISAT